MNRYKPCGSWLASDSDWSDTLVLNVPPPSLASQLPQVFVNTLNQA